ncbi:hypothetical protein NDU88_000635 [Pleurodeles waltl]|uniref:Uncharacterized protein n=1 Tax=Pleurodeles waltl TaxID=8319 RepID=A0AAV7LAC3_PLEWA|nr:hypothetical protein NDU88_000635 [Pleurodeles waltl]
MLGARAPQCRGMAGPKLGAPVPWSLCSLFRWCQALQCRGMPGPRLGASVLSLPLAPGPAVLMMPALHTAAGCCTCARLCSAEECLVLGWEPVCQVAVPSSASARPCSAE